MSKVLLLRMRWMIVFSAGVKCITQQSVVGEQSLWVVGKLRSSKTINSAAGGGEDSRQKVCAPRPSLCKFYPNTAKPLAKVS